MKKNYRKPEMSIISIHSLPVLISVSPHSTETYRIHNEYSGSDQLAKGRQEAEDEDDETYWDVDWFTE